MQDMVTKSSMLYLFALLPLLISGQLLMAQTNFYVSTSGSNSNTGTSPAQAWGTVQFGIDEINPGDTLNLMAGSYNEKIKFTNSGTTQDRLVLRNNPGDIAYLDGTGLTSAIPIVDITDKVGITVQGLNIRNNVMNDAQGILVSGACTDITIAQNDIYDINFSSDPNANVNANTNSQPLIVYGTSPVTAISNLLIVENRIRDSRTGYSEALAVNGNVMGFQILRNEVRDITNIGIDIIGHEGTCSDPNLDQARNGLIRDNLVHNCLASYATSGGIYVDGGAFLTIENNTCYRNGWGIEIGCENVGKSTTNIRVRNNLIYDNEVAGLSLGGFDFPGGSGKVEFIDVRNNTLLKNDYSGSFTGELYITFCENCLLRNNIFYTSPQNTLVYAENVPATFFMSYSLNYCLAGATALEYDWNGSTYTGFSAFQSGTGLETSSLFASPEIVSVSVNSPDFHIIGSSPAIDAGDPSIGTDSTETDIDGDPRPIAGRFDIGADEYNTVLGIASPTEARSLVIYPNPARDIVYLELEGESMAKLSYQIWNTRGQLLGEGDASSGVLRFEDLPADLYCIQFIKAGKVIGVKRLILR